MVVRRSDTAETKVRFLFLVLRSLVESPKNASKIPNVNHDLHGAEKNV